MRLGVDRRLELSVPRARDKGGKKASSVEQHKVRSTDRVEKLGLVK